MTNVEIKAKVSDFEAMRKRIRALSGTDGVLVPQEDVFFSTGRGRLKLRIFEEHRGELIFYRRADLARPRRSEYVIVPTTQVQKLREALAEACGVKAVVKKTRYLYLIGQTRVHLDRVEGLGDFLELEVVLEEGQSESVGQAIVSELMEKLGVKEGDLIAKAYVDMLETK